MTLRSWISLLTISLMPVYAIAQEEVPQPPPYPPPIYAPPPPQAAPAPLPPQCCAESEGVHRRHHRHSRIFAPGAVALTTGAGVDNYFGSGVRNVVDPGAAWNVRLLLGTSSFIALEGAYLGAYNNVDMGVASDAAGVHGRLMANGVDGDLRLQLPLRFQPYIFGGVGYNHLDLRTADGVRQQDNQLTVPAGAGFTGYLGRHATVDLRGTYRYTPDDNLRLMTRNGHLHQWLAQANVGYVF